MNRWMALGTGLAAVVAMAGAQWPAGKVCAASGSNAGNATVFTDFRGEKPGTVHRITVADLPVPYATTAARAQPHKVPRPANAWPQVPAGFKVEQFAEGLENPRLLRTAPNGDIFVAESEPGRIKVFRGITGDGKAASVHVFATGLTLPFGIAFYPPGPIPVTCTLPTPTPWCVFPITMATWKRPAPRR